ncbi:MAG: glycosyltransferase [Halioglobus sp.]|nr:glycosyltransferase [Halioglobus sp.]
MPPSVNILIPTYNQAEHLAAAVASALDQDYANLQVIVSDDASTDTTAAVLRQFSAGQRLVVSRNATNLGRVGNYRKCLYQLAFGDWVLVLDGDDYLCDKSYITQAIQAVERDPSIDLVFANAARLREDLNGQLQSPTENASLPDALPGRDLFLRFATERVSLFHNTCLYHREKACALDFYRSDIISSDWESLHRYILTGNVAFIAKDVAVWRLHGHNATRTLSTAQRIDNLTAITAPCEAASAGNVFAQQILEEWLETRLWHAAYRDVRGLIKRRDFEGYHAYLAGLRAIHPRICRRIRWSPHLLLRKLRARLR